MNRAQYVQLKKHLTCYVEHDHLIIFILFNLKFSSENQNCCALKANKKQTFEEYLNVKHYLEQNLFSLPP